MITINQTKQRQNITLEKGLFDLTLLFATGYTNPFGSTFLSYLFDDDKSKKETSIIEVMIHPMNFTFQEVGKIVLADEVNIIEFYSDFMNNAMPSLFIRGERLNREIFKNIIRNYIESSDIIPDFIQFEGDPFTRVTTEAENFDEDTKTNKDEIDVELILESMLNENNILEEIKALDITFEKGISIIGEKLTRVTHKNFRDTLMYAIQQSDLSLFQNEDNEDEDSDNDDVSK